jgi:hypothetical protein
MSPSAPCPDAAARKPWRGAGARIKGFLSADCGYRLGVAVATANRHPATSAFGWLAVNFAWFLATWAAVASLVAAAFMIGEGDHLRRRGRSRRSFRFRSSSSSSVMAAIAATVGLFLFAPAWIPGLALYLVALWWGGRALPSRLRRAAAVALSPLVAAFLSLRAAFSG